METLASLTWMATPSSMDDIGYESSRLIAFGWRCIYGPLSTSEDDGGGLMFDTTFHVVSTSYDDSIVENTILKNKCTFPLRDTPLRHLGEATTPSFGPWGQREVRLRPTVRKTERCFGYYQSVDTLEKLLPQPLAEEMEGVGCQSFTGSHTRMGLLYAS